MPRPAVANVHVLSDFRLRVEFDNGETRIFDAKPHLQGPWLGMLKNFGFFDCAFPNGRTVEWPEGQTIDPDVLYDESVAIAEDGAMKNAKRLFRKGWALLYGKFT